MKSFRLITSLIFILSALYSNAQPIFKAASSEFFLEIPSRGRYTVSLGNEIITSSNSRYRFFDLRSGRQQLIVESGNRVIYKSDVFIKPGMRSVALLRRNSLDVRDFDLARNNYDNWDRVLNNNYEDERPEYDRPGRGRPDRDSYTPVMSGPAFDRFMSSIKKAAFEKDKMEVIDLTAGYSYFTVDQITKVLNLFSFTDVKLDVVRKLYPSVADPENVYQLLDLFPFSNDKEKVKSIILSSRNQRPGR